MAAIEEVTGAYLVSLRYASGRPYVIVRCDDHPTPLLINSGHHYDATEPYAHVAIDRHNAEYHASDRRGRCLDCGDEWVEFDEVTICPECHSLNAMEVPS